MPKVKILQEVWLDPFYPNFPIQSKTNVHRKGWYTPYLKYNLLQIIIKDLGGDSTLVVCVVKVTKDVIVGKKLFPIKIIGILAWIVPAKSNYQSTVDRWGSKVPSLLKMTYLKILEIVPRLVLWKRCLENIL